MRAVYDALHVREQSESLIGSLFDESMEILDEVSVSPDRKIILREYVNSLMKRGK